MVSERSLAESSDDKSQSYTRLMLKLVVKLNVL